MERELMIRKTLKKCGISPELVGYRYLLHFINKAIENEDFHLSEEYFKFAKENNTTYSGVERAIRHCIERAFKEPNDFAKDLFEGIISERPKSSCFIYTLAEYIEIAENAKKPIEMFNSGWCEHCNAEFHSCYDNDACKGFVDAGVNKLKLKEKSYENIV